MGRLSPTGQVVGVRGVQENAQPPRKPSFLNTIAAGQKPVNDAWIMFSPANAVSRYQ